MYIFLSAIIDKLSLLERHLCKTMARKICIFREVNSRPAVMSLVERRRLGKQIKIEQ